MSSNPLDKYVGLKLKVRRNYLGLSQYKMGQISGVSFQQIQKYEKGTNRIGCSMLYDLSKILQVPISYFFEGYEDNNVNDSTLLHDNKTVLDYNSIPNINEKDVVLLIKYYMKIKDKNTKKSILDLVKSLSKADDNVEDKDINNKDNSTLNNADKTADINDTAKNNNKKSSDDNKVIDTF